MNKKQEIVFTNQISFNILGKEINIVSEEINGIKYTVANYEKHYFHLGNENPNIYAAIKFYQIWFKQIISKSHISEILDLNKCRL